MLDSVAYLAPIAQLDRVTGFEPVGREFESLWARHFSFLRKPFLRLVFFELQACAAAYWRPARRPLPVFDSNPFEPVTLFSTAKIE